MSDTLKWDSWVEKYKPITNPSGNTNFDGFMFETFGSDVQYLKDLGKSNYYYWTLIAEGDDLSIISGVHWINRLGYFVTEIPSEDKGVYVQL